MTLVTGECFDHLAPDPSVITLDVLEHGLEALRFNNQTTRPITVKEHSHRVRRLTRELGGDRHAELWAMLHDGHETLVPWGDCLRTEKTQEMREVESAVDAAIITALGVKQVIAVWDIVKIADILALYFEAMLWGGPGAIDWAPGLRADGVLVQEFGSAWMMAATYERFMPLVAPRPRECWRTEVEELLS